MTISEQQRVYIDCASGLGDYQSMSKLELANGYCEAENASDEIKRSQYWAALMLRYWYRIYEWMKNSSSCKLQLEDFVNWLNDALYIAFYYRSWWWEYEAVVRHGKLIEWKLDENGNKIPNEHYWKIDAAAADRSINYFLNAQRGREYQALNKDLRKSNVLYDSLDESVEVCGDLALEQSGATSDFDHLNSIKDLVRKFIAQNRSLEAMIIDGIAYHSSFKEIRHELPELVEDPENPLPFKREKFSYEHEFCPRLLVKHLSTIDENFMETYFKPTYDLDEDTCQEIFRKLKDANNNKLYRYIKKTLINIREDKELLQYIVNQGV